MTQRVPLSLASIPNDIFWKRKSRTFLDFLLWTTLRNQEGFVIIHWEDSITTRQKTHVMTWQRTSSFEDLKELYGHKALVFPEH